MTKSARSFFTREQLEDINMAIQSAELDTSGEIRVHIENTCEGESLDRAAYLFKHMNMHKTHLRNGVLIYLAVRNRKFAIIGDEGINKVVPENFWDDIKLTMLNHFRDGKFSEGLCTAIEMAGEHLKKNFPRSSKDINELSDEVTFDEK